jgi:hypothetical protein
MRSDDFRQRYASMGDAELLQLGQSYDSLTAPAQAALRSEFAKRNMEPPLIEEDEPTPALRNLLTVKRYRDLSEAIVARSMLASADIPAWLRDENLGRLDWQLSNFIGGLRLQVEAKDSEQALALLTSGTPEFIKLEDDTEFEQPHCPVCDSTLISFEGAYRGAALASLYLLSLPAPLGKKTWICDACGARWEQDEDDA